MLGASTPATTTIITNGLAGRPATDRLLSAWKFHLYVETDIIAKKPEKQGGGPYPGEAWNKTGDINKFFQPVNQQVTSEGGMPYIIPRDKEGEYFANKVTITLKGKFGEHEIEKVFAVNEKLAPMVVTITEFKNVTYQRAKVIVEGFRKVAKRVKIVVENLKLKR